ncbi:MAG: alpha-isopropylmalate synthase regulatory domain-containing protein [Synergistaceae bacterium]
MGKIKITDITLRESALEREVSLSFKETIETAKILDKLNIDTISLAPITKDKTDSLLVRTITTVVKKSTLSIPVGTTKESLETTWNAISHAKKPRLCVELPVSPVQMEYICKAKPNKVIEMAKSLVSEAKSLCNDVEFVAKDATRAETDFLHTIVTTAITAGAETITLCDSAGIMLPHEFENFISNLYNEIPELKDVTLSVMVSDNMSLALASSVSALRKGATEICVSVSGITTASLEDTVLLLKVRGEDSGFECNVKNTELKRSMNQINWMTRSKKDKSSPFDTGIDTKHTSDIKLDKSDDITAISKAVKNLGYDLSDEDLAKVFKTFVGVADKKSVGTKELEAIIASSAMQVPPTYELISFVINSGNIINATANICFKRDGKELSGIAVGDGPIDAAFMAIENITGHHYELDDFQIQAVTEGREAMGSALIKLRSNGKLYSGNGLSTDIIGSSISAYLNALNKISYEENHK